MFAVVGFRPTIRLLSILIKAGAQTSCRDKHGNNLLHLAAKSTQDTELVQFLCNRLTREQLVERNSDGETPLVIAINQKSADVAQLIEKMSMNAVNDGLEELLL